VSVALFVLAGFLCGSIPFGLIVSRLFYRTDIRAVGSGNIGAANALRTLGTKAGLAVLLLDALKAALPTFAAAAYAPPLVPLVALSAILGHCYSPWLKFRGGKGVATYLGAVAAFGWPGPVIFAAVWLAIVLPSGYASLASILATAASVVWVLAQGRGTPAEAGDLLFAAGALAVIVVRHRENITRLLSGSESKLDLVRRLRAG
jgi:glycerol-3-phosphate acyltransferase PlsY